MSATLGRVLQDLTRALKSAGIDEAAREARLIASEATGIAMARLSLSEQDRLTRDALDALQMMAEERLERRPLSHVLGRRAFFKHEFRVTPDVLDPRADTEALVVAALSVPFARVLDLGTGSGAILLSLLAERNDVQGVGTDLSERALRVAEGNANRLGIASRCQFLQSDWYAGLQGRFNLIVSNPPYIAAKEMDGLEPELAFEPRMALTDEGDGLSAYRTIIAGAETHLTPGGRLMVEIGWTQGSTVTEMFRQAGFDDITMWPDLEGRDRVVSGRWP